MFRSLSIAITGMLLVAGSAHATWLDFSNWDGNLINTAGQRFVNIYQDVDLFVRSTGDVEPSSAVDAHILLEGNSNEQVFAFNFSRPLDLKVELHTLDPDEFLTVNAISDLDYEHKKGNQPVIEGETFQGAGYGLTTDGVANGVVKLGETASFLLSYEAAANLKFEQLSVGVVSVAEPSSVGLTMLGMLGLLLFRRARS